MRHSINSVLKDNKLLGQWHGFYDWFCKDDSLKQRSERLLVRLQFLVDENLVNGDGHYVWFKNTCPMVGGLYDDLRISNIETNDFLGGLCTRDDQGMAKVWLLTGSGFSSDDLVEYNYRRWNLLKKDLKSNVDLRASVRTHFA